MNKELSVCIPVFIRKERDFDFLIESLKSIEIQNFKDFETVLSLDHESPHRIQVNDIRRTLPNFEDIKVVQSPFSGISANTNFAVKSAQGEYAKILFQDDLLSHEHALSEIIDCLRRTNKKWLLTGTNHYDESTKKFGPFMVPAFKKTLFRGINTISSPSVAAFRISDFLDFSTSLTLMMDCEWYVRMLHNMGKPAILPSPLVINRIHSGQAQHTLKFSIEKELEMVSRMHSRKNMRKVKCLCRS